MNRNGKKVVFTIPVVLTMLLAGCGTSTANKPGHQFSTSEGSASTQVVTLHYMLWDPNEEIGYKQSIAVFEKLHPNIKVVIEQYPWSQYWQKLETEMAAGTAPDVF